MYVISVFPCSSVHLACIVWDWSWRHHGWREIFACPPWLGSETALSTSQRANNRIPRKRHDWRHLPHSFTLPASQPAENRWTRWLLDCPRARCLFLPEAGDRFPPTRRPGVHWCRTGERHNTWNYRVPHTSPMHEKDRVRHFKFISLFILNPCDFFFG